MDSKVNKQTESSSEIPNRYIRCPDCGEQILMMPNLSEMIEAIENHLSTHGTQAKLNPIVHHLKEPIIEESLAEQALITAASMKETPNRNSTWINLE
jgi:DNA-directed RNA polymerase subunit RPC12/RpoP